MSYRRWQPGDRAVIAYCPISQLVNRTCTVLAVHNNRHGRIYVQYDHQVFYWPVIVECDVDGVAPTPNGDTPFKGRGFKSDWLRPFDDEWMDLNKKAAWDERLFKPNPNYVSGRVPFLGRTAEYVAPRRNKDK